MSLSLMAATVVLGTQSPPAQRHRDTLAAFDRVYQWMVVPGGAVFPVPTPFAYIVPLGWTEPDESPESAKIRQKFHIIIESESDHMFSKKFTQSVLEGFRQVIEEARQAEMEERAQANPALCKKSDPKNLIEPIVTGF